jgi:hypothetical protein
VTFLLDGLKARNLDAETNVILVSDHGMTPNVNEPYIQLLGNFTEEEYNRTVLWCLDYGIYPTDPKYIPVVRYCLSEWFLSLGHHFEVCGCFSFQ